MSFETWNELPTKAQIKARIDAFLRTIGEGRFEQALQICPPETFVKGEGMVIRTGLSAADTAALLEQTMYACIEGQSVVREALAKAVASDPTTWCGLITAPADVEYEDLGLDFPFEGDDDDDDDDVEVEDAPDSTRATDEGEVLANVHLCGEATDITGRYAITEVDGKFALTFHNFDVM